MVRLIISPAQKRALIFLLIGVVYWKFIEYFQWAIPCPIRWLTGIPCPGCGMGRATVCLLHGEWLLACSIHFGSYVMAFYLIYELLPASFKKQVQKNIPKPFIKGLGIFILIALIIRWLLVLFGIIQGV